MTQEKHPSMLATDKVARDIEVDAASFAAVALFVCTDETRYYLHGVLIEPCPAGGVVIAATDGHRLLAIRDPKGRSNGRFICPFPSWMHGHAAKMVTTPPDEDGDTFTVLEAAKFVRFVGGEVAVIGSERNRPDKKIAAAEIPAIDGDYPDWRKVVSSSVPVSAEALHFNPLKLAEFGTAALYVNGGVGAGRVTLIPSTDASPIAILMEGNPNFLGVLMPCKRKGVPTMPNWDKGE